MLNADECCAEGLTALEQGDHYPEAIDYDLNLWGPWLRIEAYVIPRRIIEIAREYSGERRPSDPAIRSSFDMVSYR